MESRNLSVCSLVRVELENYICKSLKCLMYDEEKTKPIMCFQCDKCFKLHKVDDQSLKRHCDTNPSRPLKPEEMHWYCKYIGETNS